MDDNDELDYEISPLTLDDLDEELVNRLKRHGMIDQNFDLQKERSTRKIDMPDGLWCDDITFCTERCGWKKCPRNCQNIRDRSVPHSFSVERPADCPKERTNCE